MNASGSGYRLSKGIEKAIRGFLSRVAPNKDNAYVNNNFLKNMGTKTENIVHQSKPSKEIGGIRNRNAMGESKKPLSQLGKIE